MAYSVWEGIWATYLAVRRNLKGDFAWFEIAGRPVLMDLRDRTVTRVLYMFGEYEPLETQLISQIIRPGMTVIDIGANSGYYTLIAARAVGERGRVVAFEPSPMNASILRANVARNGFNNTIVEEMAVLAKSSEARLYLCEINEGDHRIYDGQDNEFYNAGLSRRVISVRGVALDEYFDVASAEIDLIKLDVQGAEHEVLKGMKRILSSNYRITIVSEYWPHGLQRCGSDPKEFLYDLNRLGFQAYALGSEGGLQPVSKPDAFSNAGEKHAMTLVFSRADHSLGTQGRSSNTSTIRTSRHS